MKTKTKALALVLSAVLLVVTTVFTTMAYLTSTTSVVKNTFTYGKVEITLDEAPVNEYGEVIEGERRTVNGYKLIPGHTYTKDPTVHISKDSEACYVFVRVVDEISTIEDLIKVEDQMSANGWSKLDGEDNVWYYDEIVKPGTTSDTNAITGVTDGVDLLVFNSFKITGDAKVAAFDGKTITVQAYAVQADNFTTAAAAWTAAPITWGE